MFSNFTSIFVATLAQFILSFIWYTFLFGDLWGKIHGFDRKSKKEQESMQKEMFPLLAVQMLMTFVTTTVLALFFAELPSTWHAYGAAGWLWLGFVAPTQVASVIFGGTENKWVTRKILVMSGASLVNFMTAAFVLSSM